MLDKRRLWLIAAVLLAGLWSWNEYRSSQVLVAPAGTAAGTAATPTSPPPSPTAADTAPAKYPAFLPVQAHPVLDAIARGGPYDYRQDDGVFQNRERLLPSQARGYYREYTVVTPGSPDRGARRIVTGGDPPVEYFYTDDHYRSFRRFEMAR